MKGLWLLSTDVQSCRTTAVHRPYVRLTWAEMAVFWYVCATMALYGGGTGSDRTPLDGTRVMCETTWWLGIEPVSHVILLGDCGWLWMELVLCVTPPGDSECQYCHVWLRLLTTRCYLVILNVTCRYDTTWWFWMPVLSLLAKTAYNKMPPNDWLELGEGQHLVTAMVWTPDTVEVEPVVGLVKKYCNLIAILYCEWNIFFISRPLFSANQQ